LDYGNILTVRQRTKVLSVLASFCEVRGTDATGIAYNTDSHLTIYKRPKAAHKMWFRLPMDANVIMGHTRMTTQGNEKVNQNNHPFYGKVGDTPFALAHNGMLMNDDELQKKYRLPKTNIETDSYVAVQLLERQADLSFKSMAKVAEELEGSFTLSMLDNTNNVYFIKGNNPLCLYYWRDRNLYIYASTEEILKSALARIPYDFGIAESIEINEGDMMKISPSGARETSQFSLQNLYAYGYYGYPYRWLDEWDIEPKETGRSYKDILKSMAHTFGYTAEDVDTLLAEGFTFQDIEDFFYEGVYC
jgi:glucosamine 6-phosphate synthetase-like amidotransferase/phosphosugar isomerase protein